MELLPGDLVKTSKFGGLLGTVIAAGSDLIAVGFEEGGTIVVEDLTPEDIERRILSPREIALRQEVITLQEANGDLVNELSVWKRLVGQSS